MSANGKSISLFSIEILLLLLLLSGCAGIPPQSAPRYLVVVVDGGGIYQRSLRQKWAEQARATFPDIKLEYITTAAESSQAQKQQLNALLRRERPPNAVVVFPVDSDLLRENLIALRQQQVRVIIAGLQATDSNADSYDLRILPISQQQLLLNLVSRLRDQRDACLLANTAGPNFQQGIFQQLELILPNRQRLLPLPSLSSPLPNLENCRSVVVFEESLVNKLAWHKIKTRAQWELLVFASPSPILLSYLQSGIVNWLLDSGEGWMSYAAILASHDLLQQQGRFSVPGEIDLLRLGRVQVDGQRSVNLSLGRVFTPANSRSRAPELAPQVISWSPF